MCELFAVRRQQSALPSARMPRAQRELQISFLAPTFLERTSNEHRRAVVVIAVEHESQKRNYNNNKCLPFPFPCVCDEIRSRIMMMMIDIREFESDNQQSLLHLAAKVQLRSHLIFNLCLPKKKNFLLSAAIIYYLPTSSEARR